MSDGAKALDLEAIEARCTAAKPDGEWGVVRVEDQWGVFADAGDPVRRELVVFVPAARLGYSSPCDRDVALFLAAAKTDVPALVAEVKRLREALRSIQRIEEYVAGRTCHCNGVGCVACIARIAREGGELHS